MLVLTSTRNFFTIRPTGGTTLFRHSGRLSHGQKREHTADPAPCRWRAPVSPILGRWLAWKPTDLILGVTGNASNHCSRHCNYSLRSRKPHLRFYADLQERCLTLNLVFSRKGRKSLTRGILNTACLGSTGSRCWKKGVSQRWLCGWAPQSLQMDCPATGRQCDDISQKWAGAPLDALS